MHAERRRQRLLIPQGGMRVLVNVAAYYVLPTLGSELVLRLLPVKRLREGVWSFISPPRSKEPPQTTDATIGRVETEGEG